MSVDSSVLDLQLFYCTFDRSAATVVRCVLSWKLKFSENSGFNLYVPLEMMLRLISVQVAQVFLALLTWSLFSRPLWLGILLVLAILLEFAAGESMFIMTVIFINNPSPHPVLRESDVFRSQSVSDSYREGLGVILSGLEKSFFT